MVMIDYLKRGRMINGEYYDGNRRKGVWKLTHGVLILKDNAPDHTSQVAMTAATECRFEILPHPLYSPDMNPCDFNLFPKL